MIRPRLSDYSADDDYVDDLEIYCDEVEDNLSRAVEDIRYLYKSKIKADPDYKDWPEDKIDKYVEWFILNTVFGGRHD